jgi:hypothetical protein
MTDTPRTDANYVCFYGDGIGQWVPREFSCELERELAETKRLLVEASKDAELLKKLFEYWEADDQKNFCKLMFDIRANAAIKEQTECS